MTFGQNLRYYRRACGYSQARLAALLYVDRSALSHYERDRVQPSIRRTLQIAWVLGVEMEALFDERPEAAAAGVKRGNGR